ncbi:MAG: hypothetical protein AB8B99_19565 [Phormidesmis sp.]
MTLLTSLLGIAFYLLLGGFVTFMGAGTCIYFLRRLRLTLLTPQYHPHRTGRMIATGLVRATHTNEQYLTPLSKTPCVAYELTITESKGKNSRITHYREFRGQQNLSIQTTRGTVQIGNYTLEVIGAHFQDHQHVFSHFSHPKSAAFLAEKGIKPNSMVGTKRSLTIREFILRNGDPIRAIGKRQQQTHPVTLENALVTDQPIWQIIGLSLLFCAAGAFVAWIGFGILTLGFR